MISYPPFKLPQITFNFNPVLQNIYSLQFGVIQSVYFPPII